MSHILLKFTTGTSNFDDAGLDLDGNTLGDVKFFGLNDVAHLLNHSQTTTSMKTKLNPGCCIAYAPPITSLVAPAGSGSLGLTHIEIILGCLPCQKGLRNVVDGGERGESVAYLTEAGIGVGIVYK